MKKTLQILFVACLLLMPLSVFVLPLPFAASNVDELRQTILRYSYIFIALGGLGYLLSKYRSHPRYSIYLSCVAALGVYAILSVFFTSIAPRNFTPVALFSLSVALVGFYLGCQQKLPWSGMVGLALTLTLAIGAEHLMRSFPNDIYGPAVAKKPPPSFYDNVNVVYRQNAFRGKRPCTECGDDITRIITMGGSSTYGVPMLSSRRTYSAALQRLLDERQPEQRFEVLNGGIAAYGIMQVISALKEELLQFEPDIVTVCLWFNDSAATNRWYQIPGISDKEGYQRTRLVRAIENSWVMQKLNSSYVFRLYRYLLLELKTAVLGKPEPAKDSGRPRMTPEEYAWGLEEVIRLGQEHNFEPVFITEPLSHTKSMPQLTAGNPYIAKLVEVSKKHNIRLVDSITPLHQEREKWFFYDFIHPNSSGHRRIAEAIYEELFNDQPFSVSRVARHQVPSSHYREGDITFRARAPFLAETEATLEVAIDGEPLTSFSGLTSEFSTFVLDTEHLNSQRPLIDLSISAKLDLKPFERALRIGNTGAIAPAVLNVESGGKDYGWTVAVRVNGERFDFDYRGYNVVVVGARSGQVRSANYFDIFGSNTNNLAFARYMSDLEQYTEGGLAPIVIVAVKTDGGMEIDKDLLSPVLRNIGGSGQTPKPFESFLLIGSLGAKPGSAVERMGPAFLNLTIGNPRLIRQALVEVELLG